MLSLSELFCACVQPTSNTTLDAGKVNFTFVSFIVNEETLKQTLMYFKESVYFIFHSKATTPLADKAKHFQNLTAVAGAGRVVLKLYSFSSFCLISLSSLSRMLRVNQARRFNVFSQNKLQNELMMAMVEPITRQEWNSFMVVFSLITRALLDR